MVAHAELTLTLAEEVGGLAWLHGEDVVVEVDILLVETLNAMQMHLYGVTVECRQKLRRYYILVKHHINGVAIYPLGHLAVARHYEVHLANEWHVCLDATHEVAQCSPVAEALFKDWGVGVFLVVLLPKGV